MWLCTHLAIDSTAPWDALLPALLWPCVNSAPPIPVGTHVQVNGIALKSPLPLTVKIRLGENDDKINVEEVVGLLQAAGAAAVTVHGRCNGAGAELGMVTPLCIECGCARDRKLSNQAFGLTAPTSCLLPHHRRTMLQRYKRPASWELIERVAHMHSVPVVGNGDVLTHYEARRRMDSHGCHAVMVGRGALIKPWLFWEHREGRELAPTAAERVAIYRRLVACAWAGVLLPISWVAWLGCLLEAACHQPGSWMRGCDRCACWPKRAPHPSDPPSYTAPHPSHKRHTPPTTTTRRHEGALPGRRARQARRLLLPPMALQLLLPIQVSLSRPLPLLASCLHTHSTLCAQHMLNWLPTCTVLTAT